MIRAPVLANTRLDRVPETPFDEAADAVADFELALATVRDQHIRLIAVLGANWCPDARTLAAMLALPHMQKFLEPLARTLLIDIGRYDRNGEVRTRLGLERLDGIPAVLVITAAGIVVDRSQLYDWRTARSRAPQEVADWLARQLESESVDPADHVRD